MSKECEVKGFSLIANLDGYIVESHNGNHSHLNGVSGFLAVTANKTIDSNLDTLPTLIAVHDIVTTSDGGDLSVIDLLGLLEQLLHVSSSGTGRSITTIAEEVNVDFRNLCLLSGIQEREDVVYVTVDTTIRDLARRKKMVDNEIK